MCTWKCAWGAAARCATRHTFSGCGICAGPRPRNDTLHICYQLGSADTRGVVAHKCSGAAQELASTAFPVLTGRCVSAARHRRPQRRAFDGLTNRVRSHVRVTITRRDCTTGVAAADLRIPWRLTCSSRVAACQVDAPWRVRRAALAGRLASPTLYCNHVFCHHRFEVQARPGRFCANGALMVFANVR